MTGVQTCALPICPVQNWNDGKVQEFRDRREYNPEPSSNLPILFTSRTCPNCPAAKALLDQNGVKYRTVDAVERQDLATAYNVLSVPSFFPNPLSGSDGIIGLGAIASWARRQGS